MRIYLQPPQPSRGLQRIADALTRYLPDGWETVEHIGGADLVILYAIGRRDALQVLTGAISKSRFQKYAIIQVCLKSTMAPSAIDWLDIWDGAEVVWSYYDLFRAIEEDGGRVGVGASDRFYHAPLGADADVFRPRANLNDEKNYVIASSGLSRLSESVRECALAAAVVGGKVFHLGPAMPYDNVISKTGLTDSELAFNFGGCEFVSALRRKEGFELPAIEGLLCGARPICFDTPDYRWCYGSHALYVEETDRQSVIDQLVEVFRRGAPPVTPEERELAVKRYDWETIVGGFYERLK